MPDVSEDAIERKVRKALESQTFYKSDQTVTVATVMDNCIVINYKSSGFIDPECESFEVDFDNGMCRISGIHGRNREALYDCIEKFSKRSRMERIVLGPGVDMGMSKYFAQKGFKYVEKKKGVKNLEKILIKPKPKPKPEPQFGAVPQPLSTPPPEQPPEGS